MREIYLVLHNIRSVYNVGAILRTAEGMGVKKIVFSGYTPRYDDQRLLPHLRENLNKRIEKSALGAERKVKCYSVDDIILEIERLKQKEGFLAVGLENNITPQSVSGRIFQIRPENFSEIASALKKRVVLILGEEVDGINNSLREITDMFLEIPMYGEKESFNVSVAAGMGLMALRVLFEDEEVNSN